MLTMYITMAEFWRTDVTLTIQQNGLHKMGISLRKLVTLRFTAMMTMWTGKFNNQLCFSTNLFTNTIGSSKQEHTLWQLQLTTKLWALESIRVLNTLMEECSRPTLPPIISSISQRFLRPISHPKDLEMTISQLWEAS